MRSFYFWCFNKKFYSKGFFINLSQSSVSLCTESTGFYMKQNIGLKNVDPFHSDALKEG